VSDPRNVQAGGRPARRSAARVLKDIALFLATPFISIAYMALFPFIGLVKLVRAVAQARRATSQ